MRVHCGRSQVWSYFARNIVTGEIACKHCSSKTRSKKACNATKHLRKAHPALYAQLKQPDTIRGGQENARNAQSTTQPLATANSDRQLTIGECSAKRAKFDGGHPMQVELERLVAHAFAHNSFPYRAIESGPVRSLLMKIPRFSVPNRKQLSKSVFDLAENVRTKIKAALSKMAKVCFGIQFSLTRMKSNVSDSHYTRHLVEKRINAKLPRIVWCRL